MENNKEEIKSKVPENVEPYEMWIVIGSQPVGCFFHTFTTKYIAEEFYSKKNKEPETQAIFFGKLIKGEYVSQSKIDPAKFERIEYKIKE